jgi:protocatechuate 3,4-dioxygenase, beta subunit
LAGVFRHFCLKSAVDNRALLGGTSENLKTSSFRWSAVGNKLTPAHFESFNLEHVETNMKHNRNRRKLILFAGAVGAGSMLARIPIVHAAELMPTPAMTAGPFYPTSFPTDVDNDLTRIVGHNKTANGTALELGGRIVDTRGAPIANARIEIWQCDASGTYHHVGHDAPSMDEHFQGYGVATTDADGRYRFRTIKPVPYPGRTPHIHYIVTPLRADGKNAKTFTSQMFIEGEAQNERDFLYRSARDNKERDRLVMKLSGSGESLAGVLDVVLRV